EGEGARAPGRRVGANDFVLARAVGAVFLDAAGGVVTAVVLVGRRADAIALVLDGRCRRALALAARPDQALPCRLELREHLFGPTPIEVPDYRAGGCACRLSFLTHR